LGNWESFSESHILFRNSGDIKASFNFDALATLSFNTGQVELFGKRICLHPQEEMEIYFLNLTCDCTGGQNFGANFRIPGELEDGNTESTRKSKFIKESLLSGPISAFSVRFQAKQFFMRKLQLLSPHL